MNCYFFVEDFFAQGDYFAFYKIAKAGISTYSQYQQREKRSKKEKVTTTILVFYQETSMVIIGTVLMIAYTMLLRNR